MGRWSSVENDSEESLKKVAKIGSGPGEIEQIDRRRGHTFVYRKLFGEAELNYQFGEEWQRSP